MKKWVVSISGVVGLLIVVIGILVMTNTAPFNQMDVIEEERFSSSEINAVNVIGNVGNIKVESHQGDDIVAFVSGQTSSLFGEEFRFDTGESGGVLTIRGEQKDRAFLFSFLPSSSYAVSILIPEMTMEELNIESSVADISVLDIDAQEITLKSEVGNVEVEATPARIEVETEVGNIDMKTVTINESLKLLSEVGNINLTVEELPDQLDYSVRTSVGRTSIEPLEQRMQLEGGPVIDLETEVGDVHVLTEAD